jgi:hypothetical protein
MTTKKIILSACLFVSIAYLQLLIGKTLLFGDNFSLMVPGKLFTAAWLKLGILPLWNPTIFAGIPWIGDVNQSILYPTTLLFAIFSPAAALNINLLLHLIFSFTGAALLARRLGIAAWASLLTAILWTFSPQLTGSINNLATLQSLSWMPWIVLAALSIDTWKGKAALALAVLLQFLGGYPQHVLYSLLTAGVFSVAESWPQLSLGSWNSRGRWMRNWIIVSMLAVLISAVAWLPFLPVLQNSTRSIQTTQQAASGSLLPSELSKIVLPSIFDQPALGMKWGPSWNKPPNVMLYFTWFGLAVSALALIQLKLTTREKILLSLVAFSLILALGDNLPTFKLLQSLPLINLSRGVSTILIVPALVWSILIGLWATRLSPSERLVKLLSTTALGISFVFFALWLIVWRAFPPVWLKLDALLQLRLSQSAFHTMERDYVILDVILFSLAFFGLSLFFALKLWWRKQYAFLLLVVLIDLIFAVQGHLLFADKDVYQLKPERTEDLVSQVDTTRYRLLTRNYNSPYTDFGAYWDAVTVREPFSDSYIDADELLFHSHLRRMRDGLTPNWNMVSQTPVINGYTTLLPVDMHQTFATDTDASINNLPMIQLDHPALAQWSVRYYLVDTWFPDYDEPMPDVLLGEVGSWRLFELPDTLPRFRTSSGAEVQVLAIEETPNHLRATLEIPDESGLIIADRYDPEWRAWVNDEPGLIFEEQGMRRLEVGQGIQQLELRYHPLKFFQGLAISLTTLLVLTVGVVLEQRRRAHISKS